METLWYTEPSGNEIANPSAGQMIAFMRQEYEENWGPYSPVGVLEWHEHPDQPVPTRVGLEADSETSQLILIRHPERGWFFEFSGKTPDRWLVSLAAGGDRRKWVKHWACGEKTCFLAACFIPQDLGERVVLDFLATKEPSPVVPWVDFEPLCPRLEWTEFQRRRRERRTRFMASMSIGRTAESEEFLLPHA
jgi:hypothetical protein